MAVYFGRVTPIFPHKIIYVLYFFTISLENKERAAAMALVTMNFDVALQYLKRIPNGNLIS